MESLIKYAEKAFEIPSVVIMTMLAFLFVLKVSKRYFDSKLEDRSSRIRYTIEELKNTDQSNAYLMEQIFSERYKLVINYKEIMYFLRSSRPSLNMQLYQSCSSYFLFSSNGYKLQLSPSRSKFWLRTKGLILGFPLCQDSCRL